MAQSSAAVATSRITFKMKSSTHVGTVAFAGSSCQGKVLAALVAERIHCAEDELELFTTGGSKIFPDDLLGANSFVEVARKALELDPRRRPPPKTRSKGMAGGIGGEMVAVDHNMAVSEEERISQLQQNVGSHTGAQERFNRPQFRRQQNNDHLDNKKPPPPGYVCHGCGKSGHYIEHCPNGRLGEKPKVLTAPIGIPESMLEECDPDYTGPKYVTRDGKFVRRKVDRQSFVGVVGSSNTNDAQEGDDVPDALKCTLCSLLLRDAMTLSCCERSVCSCCLEKWVTTAMETNPDEPPVCPVCCEVLIVDDVKIADELRKEVNALKTSRKRPRAAE